MRAADIIAANVFTFGRFTTTAEAIALMQDNKVRSSIVQPSEDNAYGIVTETDIIYKVATKDVDPESVLVYQIMTKPCIVVNPDLDKEILEGERLRSQLNSARKSADVEQWLSTGIIQDRILASICQRNGKSVELTELQ